MDKLAAQQFASTLNSLAEVFDKKSVTPKALEIWFDTLKEFDTNRVFSMLNGWAKTHTKFPAPGELWKALNEDSTEKRERQAVAEKRLFEREAVHTVSEHGNAKLAEIMAILGRPKPSPYEHWKRVLATPDLTDMAYKAAENYMARFATRSMQVEREPGQDDEELAA